MTKTVSLNRITDLRKEFSEIYNFARVFAGCPKDFWPRL